MFAVETFKIALRRSLNRYNLDLVQGPLPVRVASMLSYFNIDTVLDIGANVGQYGSSLRANHFPGRIISCEPLTDAFERLDRRASKDPNWYSVNVAIGDSITEANIFITANSYSSSLMQPTGDLVAMAKGARVIGSHQVKVVTVASLIERFDIDPERTLLKIDTQGHESAVLAGAGAKLSQFAAIQVEMSTFELYQGQQLFDSIASTIRSHGFELFTIDVGMSDPVTGRMVQCDGVFLRGDLMEHHSDSSARRAGK